MRYVTYCNQTSIHSNIGEEWLIQIVRVAFVRDLHFNTSKVFVMPTNVLGISFQTNSILLLLV